MSYAIFVTLLLLICCATFTLLLDVRQRRLDHRVAKAMPAEREIANISTRRMQSASRWAFLHPMVNYKSGVTYDFRSEYVVLAGVLAGLAAFVGNGFLFQFSLWVVTVVAIVIAVLVIRSLFTLQHRWFVARLFRQLPDVIELVTSTVGAGLPVNEAFQSIARDMAQPTSGQFAIACGELSMGKTPDDVLNDIYRRTGLAEYGMFAVTLAVQMKSGGRLAETLQTLGETIRQRVTLAARAKALAGEVIFSSRALSIAPFVVFGLYYTINPQMVDKLFTDPTGKFMLGYALCSVFLGVMVIRWMIRRGAAI